MMLTKLKHRPLTTDHRPRFLPFAFLLLPSRSVLPFAFLLLTLAATVAIAQSSTATLSGTVTDERDAAVAGAEVTITNTENGFNRTLQTNDSGGFTFPLLQPASYRLTVKRTGFSPYEV